MKWFCLLLYPLTFWSWPFPPPFVSLPNITQVQLPKSKHWTQVLTLHSYLGEMRTTYNHLTEKSPHLEVWNSRPTQNHCYTIKKNHTHTQSLFLRRCQHCENRWGNVWNFKAVHHFFQPTSLPQKVSSSLLQTTACRKQTSMRDFKVPVYCVNEF